MGVFSKDIKRFWLNSWVRIKGDWEFKIRMIYKLLSK